ncbi:MAG: TRAP transporter substrate-binding protein DctP [Magnetococcales bacterium]|nr:TRAP transporter substrate-binding protein DctP [Magnetococcales bacterium]
MSLLPRFPRILFSRFPLPTSGMIIGAFFLLLLLPGSLWAENPSGNELVGEDGLISMTITAVQGPSVSYVGSMESMARKIEQASGGRIKVEISNRGRSGSEAETLKAQIKGRLEGGFTSATVLANSLPGYRLLTLPYLFNDYSQVSHFIESPIDQSLRQTAQDKQLIVLGYASYGFYGLLDFGSEERRNPTPTNSHGAGSGTSTSPSANFDSFPENRLPGVEAFKKMAVRVPLDNWITSLHKAFGMRTLVIPVEEAGVAMESGWLEGVVGTPEVLARSVLSKRAKFFYHTRHLHGWSVFTVSRRWFDKLPDDLQKILSRVVSEETRQMIDKAAAKEKKILTEWSNNWPQVLDTDRESFVAALTPLAKKAAWQVEKSLGDPWKIRKLWKHRAYPPSPEENTLPASSSR